MLEYRAIFHHPAPWKGEGEVTVDYGPIRATREAAVADRPLRSEETHGYRAGLQVRTVSEWLYEPRHQRDVIMLPDADLTSRVRCTSTNEGTCPNCFPERYSEKDARHRSDR